MTIAWNPDLKKTTLPLYQAVIEALESDISSGNLQSGTRLPTHRELADRLGVAVGTITRAYADAEKRGLIHSEGRRGTFVGESRRERLGNVNPFEPASHPIDLGRFFPPISEDPDLPAALRRLARSSQTQWLLQYTAASGLPHHRAAGASWIRRLGLVVDPESVVITSGAQHAINLILSRVVRRGEVVLAESHTYPGLKEITNYLDLKLIGVPIDDDGLLPDALDKICQRRKVAALYCNPTLHNPTTITMTESRRKNIAAVAERHGVFIIEDEINRPFVPDPPPLFSSIIPEQSFLVASVSKTVAPGLRVCFVAGPENRLTQLYDGVHASVHLISPLLLEILSLWVNDGTVDRTIRSRIAEATQRQKMFHEIIGCRHDVRACPSGFFSWLLLPDSWTAHRYVAEARAKDIAISPAEIFVLEKCKPVNAVRICLGSDIGREALRDALTVLADILDNPSRSGFPSI